MVRRVVSGGIVPGIVSGLAAGVMFFGVGGMVGMRVMSMAVGWDAQFGVVGTGELAVVSTVVGMIGGMIFQLAVETEFMPRLAATNGATFGFLLFVVLIPVAPHHLLLNAVHDDNSISLLVSVFGLLFVGYGVTLDVLFRELRGKAKSVRTEIS